jgi:lipoprotein NlpD
MQWKYGLSLCFLGLLQVLLLNSCGGNVRAPVEAPGEAVKKTTPGTTPALVAGTKQLPAYYVVNKGDTLYSIAWNYGFDYRDVADWNAINSPYVIYPGQRIRLNGKQGPAGLPGASTAPAPAAVLTPGPIIIKRKTGNDESIQKEPVPNEPVQKETIPSPPPPGVVQQGPPPDGAFTWSWPTQGNIIRAETPVAKNGIDIAGKQGQQIYASAPGEVVYSGSGLLGYGKLIIIKHNDTFLSAYAHNSDLLVKEGDRVKGGQNIALMGETANGKALLHFEIRKNGQPVDPLKYLPGNN